MNKCELVEAALRDITKYGCLETIDDLELSLCEKLDAHLQDYFSSSCEEDSCERTQILDYWDLQDMVAYYKENAR